MKILIVSVFALLSCIEAIRYKGHGSPKDEIKEQVESDSEDVPLTMEEDCFTKLERTITKFGEKVGKLTEDSSVGNLLDLSNQRVIISMRLNNLDIATLDDLDYALDRMDGLKRLLDGYTEDFNAFKNKIEEKLGEDEEDENAV
eukprot:Platyproteum_vivax@DN1383_c0_g1_i1.p1